MKDIYFIICTLKLVKCEEKNKTLYNFSNLSIIKHRIDIFML